MPSSVLSIDDIKRILGDITQSNSMAILTLCPTLADVEQAAAWASGDGDLLAKNGHPQSGIVRQIVDILATDEEEYERG